MMPVSNPLPIPMTICDLFIAVILPAIVTTTVYQLLAWLDRRRSNNRSD